MEALPLYSNVKPQNVRYRTERLWPDYYDDSVRTGGNGIPIRSARSLGPSVR